jgi:DNA-binding XRE family transcriptional regulator
MQHITAQQSRDARRELSLSQAEVAKALDLNRQYVSEMETGFSTRLTNTQLKKLRTFYEDKIAEANAKGAQISLTFGAPDAPTDSKPDQVPVQRTVLAIRHLSIDPTLDDAQVDATLEKIAANDAQAEKIFQRKASEGLLTGWDEATDYALRDIFGLFAANYALLRHLQGRSLVVKPDANGKISSISDLFSHLFHQENSHLVSPSAEPEIPDSENGEVTE